MSRLDSFIRRLEAQRACLERGADLVGAAAGAVIELGLGNGRTYDHLRQLFPDRDIYVCEREIAAHPDSVPPRDRLLLGDMRETLPAAPYLVDAVILAHFDAGSGDAAANRVLAATVAPLLMPLLREGAVLVSEPAIGLAGLAELALPEGVAIGRYHLYRRIKDPA